MRQAHRRIQHARLDRVFSPPFFSLYTPYYSFVTFELMNLNFFFFLLPSELRPPLEELDDAYISGAC